MASGVKVADEVVEVYNEIKTKAQKTNRKKAAFFCIEEVLQKDGVKKVDTIVVDKSKEILQSDEDPFGKFVEAFPEKDCCYALYDASFDTCETKKEELVFVMWAPDNAPLKKKMIYASSKDAIKNKLVGLKHEWQVNEPSELNRASLAEKLGSGVIRLEGQCCQK